MGFAQKASSWEDYERLEEKTGDKNAEPVENAAYIDAAMGMSKDESPTSMCDENDQSKPGSTDGETFRRMIEYTQNNKKEA